MSINDIHLPHLERFRPYYRAPMLMLGNLGSAMPGYDTAREYFAQWVGDSYFTLDLDGGDLRLDLNKDLKLSQTFRDAGAIQGRTVFNFGTLEHVWNVQNAWGNALRAVEVGGYFLSVGPVSGYKDHGLHVTSAAAIVSFVTKNGFTILDRWFTNREVGTNMWMAATKTRHIADLADFEPAWQVYADGEKQPVT